MAGSGVLDSVVSYDADFRLPLGILLSFGGLLIFLVPTAGLAALIGSRFTKGRFATVVLNLLGASAALLVFGAGLSILWAYQSAQILAQRQEAELLARAEQGITSAQMVLANYDYNNCLFSDQSVPCVCPEALHWYRQAAFHGERTAIHSLSNAYHNCAPGDQDSNLVLAQFWWNIISDDPDGQYSYVTSERWRPLYEFVPYASDGTMTASEMSVTRAREVFADPDMSAADRQLAIDDAVRELPPRLSGDLND